MTKHLTLRLAWHNDGWNGKVCQNPKANTYCVGRHSYPGEMIKENRDLAWEQENAGKPCHQLDKIVPCAYSINAFGKETIRAQSVPPAWFSDHSQTKFFDLPPATVSTWPYAGMYSDDVNRSENERQKYNYDKRLQNARDHFAEVSPDKSLIFYYANYSNPFSTDEERRYVVVGISRLKQVGDVMFYEGVSEQNRQKYGGGFVWQLPITSHYPNEGFRIPYERYQDDPEVLDRILFIPEQPSLFKHACKHVNHDEALSMVERLLEIVKVLIDQEDPTEDWIARKSWLQGLLNELWSNRGKFPGLGSVLDYLEFSEGIDWFKHQVEKGKEGTAKEQLFQLLNGELSSLKGLDLSDRERRKVSREWKLRTPTEQQLLTEVLPRFDLSVNQIRNILAEERAKNSLYCSLEDIVQNPYLLSEQYEGDDYEDYITFSTIDHGILSSSDLGLDPIFTKNDAERFRALVINQLRREQVHIFVSSKKVIHDINNKLSYLPEWKNQQYTERYLDVDEEFLSEAVFIRSVEDEKYLYLKSVYGNERFIQGKIKDLLSRPDIPIRVPVTETYFFNELFDENSDLPTRAATEYDAIIKGQADVSRQVFHKPLCVIAGAAGTGKTTILRSIIKAARKAHGIGHPIVLLAPTGKASERLKEKTEMEASTIHSFLAKLGWINENFTLRENGGQVQSDIGTLIIDESSMIDLDLFATLFKAINWNALQRLILVGDPNQLPPIGRGKVFYDVITYLKEYFPENYGKLQQNVRQLENRVKDEGNGILQLAELYIQENQKEDGYDKSRREALLKELQEGGKVDKDLEIVYWDNTDILEIQLKSTILRHLQTYTNGEVDTDNPSRLWQAAHKKSTKRGGFLQILSPRRGENYGIDHLNDLMQEVFNDYHRNHNNVEGIAIYDKVIQFRNRPASNPIYAFDKSDGKSKPVNIFNGEIGFVKPHAFDRKKWKWSGYHINKFQVVFDHKDHLWVGYGKKAGVNEKGYNVSEKPEENLELAYAISVHKAQGSEFERVYLILPKGASSLLSMELMYTAITRAQKHLTVFVQQDVSTFTSMARIENSNMLKINSSLFEFAPLPEAIFSAANWYEDKKVFHTLSRYLVRSKSEVIIANILYSRGIEFVYEKPLFAKDGTFYLPDFTIQWRGQEYYWEHVGRLDKDRYRNHWDTKKKWYDQHFPGQLITTFENPSLSRDIDSVLDEYFLQEEAPSDEELVLEFGVSGKEIIEKIEILMLGQQQLAENVQAIKIDLLTFQSEFNKIKEASLDFDQAVSKLYQALDNIQPPSLDSYSASISNWLSRVEVLEQDSVTYLASAEFLFDSIQRADGKDYSPFVLQYTRTIENEIWKKLFIPFATTFLESRTEEEVDQFLQPELADKKVNSFASMLKRGRTDFTLGAMQFVLGLAKNPNGSTFQKSALLKEFRDFASSVFTENIFQKELVKNIQVVTTNYRNKAAHPYMLSITAAEECRDKVRGILGSIVSAVKED